MSIINLSALPNDKAIFFDACVWLLYLSDMYAQDISLPAAKNTPEYCYFEYYSARSDRPKIHVSDVLVTELAKNWSVVVSILKKKCRAENIDFNIFKSNFDISRLWQKFIDWEDRELVLRVRADDEPTLSDKFNKSPFQYVQHNERGADGQARAMIDWGDFCHYILCQALDLALVTHDGGFSNILRDPPAGKEIDIYTALPSLLARNTP